MQARTAAFVSSFFEHDWITHLPDQAIVIMTVLSNEGAASFARIAELFADDGRVTTSCPPWEPLTRWTDQELTDLRENWGDEDEPQTSAAELMIAEQARRAENIAEFDQYSAALGLPPMRTMADLLEFMVATTVLTRDTDGVEPTYAVNPEPLDPDQVLALGPKERAKAQEQRWCRQTEPVAQEIIWLMDQAGGPRLTEKTTSLSELATELAIDADAVRAGLERLVRDPGFSTNVEPKRLREHQQLTIHADWELFDRTRTIVYGP